MQSSSLQHGVQCKAGTQRPAKRKWHCQCAATVEQTDVKRTPPYWTGVVNRPTYVRTYDLVFDLGRL